MWLMGGRRRERGQALFVVVGAMTVVFVIGAIAVDIGLWLSDRRAVQSAADLAALAGAQDLPGDEAEAIASACAWAENNGFVDGVAGVGVSVELLNSDDLSSVAAGSCGGGAGTAGFGCAAGRCNAIRVTISKPGGRLFTSIIGLATEVTATGSAVAGVNVDLVTANTLLLFDASGAMLIDCNQTRSNPGCGIKEGKAAAAGFVELLTGGTSDGGSAVGFLPYNNCYNPPAPPPNQYLCVEEAHVIPPTTDAGPLLAAINAIGARGLVNVCLPLARAAEFLGSEPAPGTVVFLSNGDNVTYRDSNAFGVVPHCRPTSLTAVQLQVPRCLAPAVQERELDVKAWQSAEALKARGAQVYVIGLDVCGPDDGRSASDAGYCAGIGDTAHDSVADQRLLKCIASSDEHYIPVATPLGLHDAFTELATEIAERGLLR